MKSYMKQMQSLAAVVVLLFGAGCTDTYVEEYVAQAPQIESFSPATALSGDDTPIIVTGQNLQAVSKAYIGGREVTILERVSNTRLTIVATKAARTGKVSLSNEIGKAESQSEMTITYPKPVLNVEALPAKADMFGELTLKGASMAVIQTVRVTASGVEDAEGREAEILSQDAAEVVVKIPYVETGKARITLTYMEADDEVETPLASAPEIDIVRLIPEVDAPAFDRLIVGRITTLTGKNLDQINAVRVGGIKATIGKQEAAKLTFTVPMISGFVEGDGNSTDLKIDFFAEFEHADIKTSIPATVLRYKIWEGMTTFCQANTCIRLENFFSPETGKVYQNSLWRTDVDALSAAKNGACCSAVQIPLVSATEYNSVNPYFFFSGNNAGTMQINSPAGSASQLRNIYTERGVSASRLFPSTANAYGTPVLVFRYLDPASTVQAELDLIRKVSDLSFDVIDNVSFPIDVAGKTIAGVNVSTLDNAVNSDKWAKGVFTPGENKLDAPVDAILMVLYLNNKGVSGDPLANVKRIGFLRITSVNYRVLVNGSNIPPSLSDVTFNAYWQKEDYNY